MIGRARWPALQILRARDGRQKSRARWSGGFKRRVVSWCGRPSHVSPLRRTLKRGRVSNWRPTRVALIPPIRIRHSAESVIVPSDCFPELGLKPALSERHRSESDARAFRTVVETLTNNL